MIPRDELFLFNSCEIIALISAAQFYLPMNFRKLLPLLAMLPVHLPADAPSQNLLLADHTTRQYLILSLDGEVIWQRPGKGLFEAWALADGSLILADRDQVQKVIPGFGIDGQDTVVWTYSYANGVEDKDMRAGFV